MREIERHNPPLAGVLPKTYNLFTSTLLKELLKKVSEIPATLDYDAFGEFDFVLANPPLNVNAVDRERLADMVGAGRRFPFGLPRTDNANSLWIQLFYSALNSHGRAGFVMANSASDARSSEQELRRKLIEARAVDVMVAVGPNMFYTVTLPCTLWFLDKGKAKTARAHRDWTPAQIGFIANLVRLYRGEALDLTVGGSETATRLRETFSLSPRGRGPGRGGTPLSRRPRPVQSRDPGRNRSPGLVAQPRSLRRRRAGRGGQRRGLQGTARNPERGTGSAECASTGAGADYRCERGADYRGVMVGVSFGDIPIDALCERVTAGSTPLRSRADFYDGGTIDWYKTGELEDWYLRPAEERTTERALKETSANLFPADTVLMAMYGDGRTITSMGMLRTPAATNQACSAMIVNKEKCDPRYFF
jgi:hypothetical protein